MIDAVGTVTPQPSPDEIRAFAESAARDAAKASIRFAHETLVTTIRGYAAWAVLFTDLPLDPAALFNRRVLVIGLRQAFRGLDEQSRTDVEAQLVYVSEALLGSNPQPGDAITWHTPYSHSELRKHRIWAEAQPTSAAKRSARAVVALGAGCGLTEQEIGAVRSTHVVHDRWGILVTVRGRRPRTVPVLARWEATLRQAQRGPVGPLLVSEWPSDGGPDLRRLRASWFVTLLDADTPIALLLATAGYRSTRPLEPYIQHLQAVPDIAARRALTRRERSWL